MVASHRAGTTRVHLSTVKTYKPYAPRETLKSGRLGDKLAPGVGGFWRKTCSLGGRA